MFISMAGAEKIPARFQIGFPLPADKHSAEIPGDHCWAEFYLDSVGWVPVDISEAWKHQEKHDYFFGAHDVNRVQFTQGRDLKLAPAQEGPPLNYFVYPYVEIGGKEHPNVAIAFSFEDAGSTPTKGQRLTLEICTESFENFAPMGYPEMRSASPRMAGESEVLHGTPLRSELPLGSKRRIASLRSANRVADGTVRINRLGRSIVPQRSWLTYHDVVPYDR